MTNAAQKSANDGALGTADAAAPVDETQRKLDYYRRLLDSAAGENLRKDYEISSLRKEIGNHVRAFELLSDLQGRIGVQQDVGEILKTVMTSINASLGVDRTVILQPAEREGVFEPWFWTGYTEFGQVEEFEERLRNFSVELPEFAQPDKVLLVNSETEPTDSTVALAEGLDLPFFVGVPVVVDGRPIALIVSGRLKEASALFAPLGESDAKTFVALAGLVSAVVQNMRVAVLEEMHRLKTDFFANISHEFRTPITLTLGPLSGLMQGRYGEVPDLAKEQLRAVQSSQQRLLLLVNQLLDIAKTESGAMFLRAAKVPSMAALVAGRVAYFEGLADKRDIALVVETDPAVDEHDVYVDVEKFDRILLNLLSNAMKFTRPGGKVTTTATVGDGKLHLSVTDTGVGIPAEQLPHIFDRFRQADSGQSREFAGTGIGLALVHEFVELHGGEIHVTSVVDRGTTFHLRLPLGADHLSEADIGEWKAEDENASGTDGVVLEADAASAQARPTQDTCAANLQAGAQHDDERATVLYVDDNPELRFYVRDVLVDDYNVYLAEDGVVGLERARELKPDLILSDLMMPNMDGGQFCAAVRRDTALASTPFILLTAKAGTEDRVAGLEDGADDYLGKPFVERELRARLANLIRIRRQEKRLSEETNAAREIQRRLLPDWPVAADSFVVDAVYEPCVELSGDFFDVVVVDGLMWVYLVDVTSHGAAAAAVTMLIKEMIRGVIDAAGPVPVAELLARVQERYAKLGLDYDAGVQVVRLDRARGTFEYSSGNAPPAMKITAGAAPEPISIAPGPGLSSRSGTAELRYDTFVGRLADDETIYLYTDGCVEFESKRRRFGTRRLVRLLVESEAVGDWSNHVLRQLQASSDDGSFEDDITLIRITRSLAGAQGEQTT